ncbi:MAG: gamma-glutamyl-gamma-aminobutyrate hydrolase [Spirochaetae bacterium HGW-Spirochaetae-9]|nr:MAG: gamma-glutamyl-gamma-aminobutyrate hydrolase [Spirochaetae bacterium HGW-Spirochaetae-9]
MKPRIGISTFFDNQGRSDYSAVNRNYVDSVLRGGGLPCPIPVCSDLALAAAYVEAVDGLLLSGGKDIEPAFYNEEPALGLGSIDAERDAWELALFAQAAKAGIPVFGICRGHQLINVAMGGSLVQDLVQTSPEDEVMALPHYPKDFPMDRLYHHIKIDEGSLLRDIFGKARLRVNSFHHQAVKVLAPGLKATAAAPDGVIEGYESIDASRFILGVQFHPEALTAKFPEFIPLFRAFIEACGQSA